VLSKGRNQSEVTNQERDKKLKKFGRGQCLSQGDKPEKMGTGVPLSMKVEGKTY